MIITTYATRSNSLLRLPTYNLYDYVLTPETIPELAGRICYRSVSKMGHASGFLAARMAEGHTDIFEHVWITAVLVDENESIIKIFAPHRYVWITQDVLGPTRSVSANMRVWMELGRSNLLARHVVARYLPSLYPNVLTPPVEEQVTFHKMYKIAGQAIVNLAGIHRPHVGIPDIDSAVRPPDDQHSAATFILENVSRALTHQLVRHRLLSFSQESQRYVDLQKGGWEAIVPPAISDNHQAQVVMDETWATIEAAYDKLRAMGIRKEDARFLLPNATSTTIMVTGSIAAWRDVFWQRCAPDAQWEIRGVACAMRDLLKETGMYDD